MVYVGIDLGGTNIRCGVTDPEGHLLAKTSRLTQAGRNWREIVRDIAEGSSEALENCGLDWSSVQALGIGVPGIVDNAAGMVVACTNLSWYDLPLREELGRYVNAPVLMENDANAAALAEYYAGVSAGCESSVLITLGTGVGSGIVMHGRPWPGAFGQAGELGHTILVPDGIPCTCGRNGCMERYCSGSALAFAGKQACWADPDTALWKKAEGDLERLSAKLVVDAAREGDPHALRVFGRFAHYLAIAIDNVISMMNPQMIVIGGGVSRAGSFLLEAVRERIPRTEMEVPRPMPRIELARLGSEAGLIGAALLGRQLEE